MNKLLAAIFCYILALTASTHAQAAESRLAANPHNVFEVLYADAEEAVAHTLNQKGIGDKLSVTITGRKNRVLFAYEKPTTIEVRGLQLEKRDNRWSASLLFVADGEVVSALPATGRYAEIIEIPVLKREVRSGDIISESDIEVRDFPITHTRSDTVTDISGLLGKTPLHNISPSRPIRMHEIANPPLIKKNSIVEMQYNSPGMSITTIGQALDDGAAGDVINIRNTASKKIIRAVVADSRSVRVIAPGTETSELTGVGHVIN